MCIINKFHACSRRAALFLALAGVGALSAGAAKGVVIDQYGLPISSALVTVKGTANSVVTSLDGTFNLGNDRNQTVVVSAPGYQTIEFNIGALKRAADVGDVKIVLSELYVAQKSTIPGLYGPMAANSYVGAESTVYTDEINRTMGYTILPGLVGKMAGLNIMQYRGARTRILESSSSLDLAGWIPKLGQGIYGDNSEYGLSSRGKGVIVYVDGIERDFFSIDPDAVESVSIQKDALSTMFNGMRSSRPVLFITTKNPQSKGFRVSFTGRCGVSSPVKTPKPLSAANYAYLLNEALTNDGRQPLYDREDYYAYLNGNDPLRHPDVDWYGKTLRDHGTSQYYNVNVAGGTKFARFFVNAGYYNENGLFDDLNEGYSTELSSKRYSIDSKIDMRITDDFTAGVSILARLDEGNQPGASGGGYGSLLSDIYGTPNNAYPLQNPNGTWGGNVSFTNNLYAKASESGYIMDATRDLLGMLNLKYDFNRYVKGLSAYAMGSVSVQNRSATFRTLSRPVYEYAVNDEGQIVYNRYGNASPQGNSYTSVATYQQLWGRLGLDYERTFALHSFKLGVGADTRQIINNYDLPALPSNVTESASYDFAKRYFMQVAVTQSYYNRYRPGRRWGNFYAVGAGWDMAQESFMETTRGWLDKLKLRVVYGHTGDGIENSGYYNYYQKYTTNAYGGYGWGSTYGNPWYTYAITPMANPNLTWEKAHKRNVGVDASLLGNRLQLQADYYNDEYYDLLQTRGKNTGLLGTSYPVENIGRQRRSGGEITLTWQDHIGTFNYFITGNWNIEKSRVLYIDEQAQPYDYLVRTGRPVGVTYGLIADGFFTSMEEISNSPVLAGYNNIQPGDIKYRDLNGDGVIDEFDNTVIGGDKPFQYFGLNLGFDWNGVEFSTDWQGVYNRDLYINDGVLTEGFQRIGQHFGQGYELLMGRWTPETASTAILPRLSAGGNPYNHVGSSFWMKNGNFIRCRNLYVGYTLPQTFCRNYLGGVRPKLFANVQNLCTVAGCSWVDPEVGFTSYPLQRTWSVGVNLKF